MKSRRAIGLVQALLMMLLVISSAALSEDIDLFTAFPPGSEQEGKPTVLIAWQTPSSGNSSAAGLCRYADEDPNSNAAKPSLGATLYGEQQCALVNALHEMRGNESLLGEFYLAIMMYKTNSCADLHLDRVEMSDDGITDAIESIKSLSLENDIKGASTRVADHLQEAWAFLNGRSGDYSCSGRSYSDQSVMGSQCSDSYIIHLGSAFGSPGPRDGSGNNALNALGNELKDVFQFPVGSSEFDQFYSNVNVAGFSGQNYRSALPWARFMKRAPISESRYDDTNVTTYTISVFDGGPGQGNQQFRAKDQNIINYFSTMARLGGGKTFEADVNNIDSQTGRWDELSSALLSIFNEVQAVSSVFASASLPASANAQGTFLNQVYIAMFRPVAGAKPRWMGNLKQYQMGFDIGGNLVLTDATHDPDGDVPAQPITSSVTGSLLPSAVSFWTMTDAEAKAATGGAGSPWPEDGFWRNNPELSDQSDYPDGDLVDKGGVSQMLRVRHLTGAVDRKLLTCALNGCSQQLKPFSQAEAGSLGLSSDLVTWVRGEVVASAGEEDPPGPCPDDGSNCSVKVRSAIHGDVIHSRPAVVNYGGQDEGDIVVFYGANDGIFRAVNGNQGGAGQQGYIGNVKPGDELWGFVAPEFFDRLQRIYDNDPLLQIPASREDDSLARKDYFFDGSPTVLQETRSFAPPETEGKVFLYLTARRGGGMVYALDITDPANPEYIWSIRNAAEIEQTWSRPRVGLLKGYNTTLEGNKVVSRPVLIMGAGYDPAEDEIEVSVGGVVQRSPGPGASGGVNTKGRGVLILDAVTGKVLWAMVGSCSGLEVAQGGVCIDGDSNLFHRAIPADIAITQTLDGHVSHLYAADVGANIWRIDIEQKTSGFLFAEDISVHHFASLGGTGNNARKFLFAPEVVRLSSDYNLVLASSGDREHPLATQFDTPGLAHNVTNRFYALKDSSNAFTITEEHSGLVDISDIGEEGFDIRSNDAIGFYGTFRPGEQGVNAPVSIAGKFFFATNQPDLLVPEDTEDSPNGQSRGMCAANLGTARSYQVNFIDGTFTSQLFVGGGLPPTAIAGLVKVGDQLVPFTLGADGVTQYDVGQIEPPVPPNRNRTYWYFE